MTLETRDSDISVDCAFQERDWSSTPLGPRSQWPESLKTALSIALKSRFPIIIFWGPEFVQLYNQAYRPIIGDKHPRALGQRARDCFPEIWGSIGPMLETVLHTGEATWSEDLMLPLVRDGAPGEYYFTFSYSPIAGPHGNAGVFCAVQETTAAVLRRREAEARARELLELNRAKDTFLSNISHEFRTPLALMIAPLASALARSDDPQIRKAIEVANRNAERLHHLVDSLLTFSRIEAGRLEPRFAAVDLTALTRELVSAFESSAMQAGLTLTYDAQSEMRATVDRDMWERIIFNLLTNAIKYTLDGGIEVHLDRVADDAVLTVSDSGVGIPEAERERIFERFHRLESNGRSAEGAGIGLALTRDLVQLHGGTVEVDGRAGGGSMFTVRIPLRAPAPEARLEETHHSSALTQSLAEVAGWLDGPAAAATTDRTRAHVLVVDDNADLRGYLSEMLSPRYRVSLARSGTEALAVVERDRPHLVLSDVMMPGMDGHALVRAIRSLQGGDEIPVILLSARAGAEAAVEGLASGADDYIAKPFSESEVHARVDAQLRLANARRSAEHQLAKNLVSFHALANSLPAMVWTAASDGTRDFANDAWYEYTGLPSGKQWQSAIHPDDFELFQRDWNRAISGERTAFEQDYRLWHARTGRYRWVSAHVSRLTIGSEELWIGTTIDVEDRKRRELANEFLARAGVFLNQTLDISDTFAQLAQLAVERICDYCVFYLVEGDDVRRTAWLHRDPGIQPILDEAVALGPDPADPKWLVQQVIASGREVTWKRGDVMQVSNPASQRYYQLIEELELSSVVTVPVRLGATVYGAFALARTGDHEPFDAFDVETIMQLADRAALALANADLYEREHRIALSFQSAALPDAISTRGGIEIDAHYVASRSEARVGGDWYDTELLPDGRLLVSIGDVSGSGLEAAVVMSMMRTAIRSVAHIYADPATILEAAQGGAERRLKDHFATVFIAVIDPVLARLTYASAGHTRPLLLVDGEAVEMVAEGLPVGTFFEEPRTSYTMELPQNATLVMFTDGLTEGLGEFLPGEEAIRRYVQSPAFKQNPTARGLYEAMLPDGSGDDVAILIARISLAQAASSAIHIPLTIESPHDASRARDIISRVLIEEHVLEGEALENARLIIGELTANVARHAPGEALAVIDVWNRFPVFHLVDRGLGFRYSNRLPPIFSESGRGLFIASALARRLEVLPDLDGGSHVIAVLNR